MARRLTTEERIERAQEIHDQRWNAMVRKDEERIRRELERAERKAQTRRSRMRTV